MKELLTLTLVLFCNDNTRLALENILVMFKQHLSTTILRVFVVGCLCSSYNLWFSHPTTMKTIPVCFTGKMKWWLDFGPQAVKC